VKKKNPETRIQNSEERAATFLLAPEFWLLNSTPRAITREPLPPESRTQNSEERAATSLLAPEFWLLNSTPAAVTREPLPPMTDEQKNVIEEMK